MATRRITSTRLSLRGRPTEVPQDRQGNRRTPVSAPAAPVRNRRVLGDIGIVVHVNVLDGKIQLPTGINRPITRSFGAQLLKKAQADPSKVWHRCLEVVRLENTIIFPLVSDVLEEWWITSRALISKQKR